MKKNLSMILALLLLCSSGTFWGESVFKEYSIRSSLTIKGSLKKEFLWQGETVNQIKIKTSSLLLEAMEKTDLKSPQKTDFTAGIKLFVPQLNTVIFAGQTALGGTASTLKQPGFTFPSPLAARQTGLQDPGLKPALSTESFSQENLGIAASIKYQNEQNQLSFGVDAAAFLSKKLFSSIYMNAELENARFQMALATAGFESREASSDSWYQQNPWHPECRLMALYFKTGIDFKTFVAEAGAGINQTPWGFPAYYARTRLAINTGPFYISIQGYGSNQSFETPSRSTMEKTWQLTMNPQYLFEFSQSSLNLGLSAEFFGYGKSSRSPVQNFRLACSWNNDDSSLEAQSSLCFQDEFYLEKSEWELNARKDFGTVKSTANLTLESQKKYSILEAQELLEFKKSPVKSIRLSAEIPIGEGNSKTPVLSAATVVEFTTKSFTFRGNLEFSAGF